MKYKYFVNNQEMKRKDFMFELQKCCLKVVCVEPIGMLGTMDICEVDMKKFNSHMRNVNNGMTIIFTGTNKVFKRKAANK